MGSYLSLFGKTAPVVPVSECTETRLEIKNIPIRHRPTTLESQLDYEEEPKREGVQNGNTPKGE